MVITVKKRGKKAAKNANPLQRRLAQIDETVRKEHSLPLVNIEGDIAKLEKFSWLSPVAGQRLDIIQKHLEKAAEKTHLNEPTVDALRARELIGKIAELRKKVK